MPDGGTLFKEYERSVNRMLVLASRADPDVPVPACPAWTARNLVSHVIGTAAFLASGKALPSDVQGWIDGEVRERERRSWTELAEEWDALRERLPRVAGDGLVIDAVTHEQDLRSSIGGAAVDHDAGLTAVLPCLIAHVRGLAPFGEGPGVRLRTPTRDLVIGSHGIGLTVRLADDWELSRVLACRRSAEQLDALPAEGDRALLRTLVGRYPLPEAPLDWREDRI